jgi:hypothetical protein
MTTRCASEKFKRTVSRIPRTTSYMNSFKLQATVDRQYKKENRQTTANNIQLTTTKKKEVDL